MPYSSTAELYFIVAMMTLIIVVCAVACFLFFRTFKREKQSKLEAAAKKKNVQKTVETAKTE